MKYLRLNSFIYTYSKDYSAEDILNILEKMMEETGDADKFLRGHGLIGTRTFVTPIFDYEFEYNRNRWERVD
jgi:hypothetical protein